MHFQNLVVSQQVDYSYGERDFTIAIGINQIYADLHKYIININTISLHGCQM